MCTGQVDNYPELYAPILIVNAPGWIAGPWALFKPLIPAETRRKISILSRDATLPALEQHVERQYIPEFLGGGASMARGGGGGLPPFPRADVVPKTEPLVPPPAA